MLSAVLPGNAGIQELGGLVVRQQQLADAHQAVHLVGILFAPGHVVDLYGGARRQQGSLPIGDGQLAMDPLLAHREWILPHELLQRLGIVALHHQSHPATTGRLVGSALGVVGHSHGPAGRDQLACQDRLPRSGGLGLDGRLLASPACTD